MTILWVKGHNELWFLECVQIHPPCPGHLIVLTLLNSRQYWSVIRAMDILRNGPGRSLGDKSGTREILPCPVSTTRLRCQAFFSMPGYKKQIPGRQHHLFYTSEQSDFKSFYFLLVDFTLFYCLLKHFKERETATTPAPSELHPCFGPALG
jgi:hypothetical protein